MIKTTDNTFKVIGALFNNRDMTYHDLSRSTHLSVMGVSKIVRKLAGEGIVSIKSIGKSKTPELVLSKSNLEIFVLAERFRFNEFINRHKGLKGFLLTLRGSLHSDFSLVFGSYASGEESSGSDLDLMVVSNKDNIEAINKAKSLLSVEVNPLFIKRKDFMTQCKRNHRLYREIIDGKRVMINGEYNFWELLVSL